MALLFIDGFDHYATADLTKKWTSVTGSIAINATAGRRGGGALRRDTSGAQHANLTIPATTSFVIGFSLKTAAFAPSVAVSLLSLLDSGTSQCELNVNAAGTLSVTRNGAAVTGGTSTLALSINTEYYIEFKVTIADSIAANSCKVRVNGADWITVTAGQDLKNTTNANANQVRLGNSLSSNFGGPYDYDDFYLCDQSGSTNNDFLGDVRIDTLFPNGAGNYQAWTPSTGTDHAALVDETAPNTTDYLTGGAAGTKETLALASTPSSGTVLGIQVCNAVSKTDAGTSTVKNLIRSGTTDANGANFSPSTSYLYSLSVHETDPATSAAWTVSAVNALEAGAEVVA